MKYENITIKDIAKALNLSYSTVSSALKGSYKISEATQQLVKEYAEAHQLPAQPDVDVSRFQELHEHGLPMVFFDRVTNEIPSHQVITDNSGGAYAATRHLIERGYKRIATITSTPYLSISLERLDGYKKALTESGMPVHDAYIQYCPHGGMVIEEKKLHSLICYNYLNHPMPCLLPATG